MVAGFTLSVIALARGAAQPPPRRNHGSFLYLMHVQTMKTFNKGWIVSPPPTVRFCVQSGSSVGSLSFSPSQLLQGSSHNRH